MYVVHDDDGLWHIEDDGTVLPDAMAAGLDIESGVRESLLRGILASEGAEYDLETFQIRTPPLSEAEISDAAMRFVSALIRMQDLALLSKENVKASFAEDVARALRERKSDNYEIVMNDKHDTLSPDILIRKVGYGFNQLRVYAASSDVRILEAMISYKSANVDDSPMVAVVNRRRGGVSEKRTITATNMGLPLAVVHDDSYDWVDRVLNAADTSARTA